MHSEVWRKERSLPNQAIDDLHNTLCLFCIDQRSDLLTIWNEKEAKLLEIAVSPPGTRGMVASFWREGAINSDNEFLSINVIGQRTGWTSFDQSKLLLDSRVGLRVGEIKVGCVVWRCEEWARGIGRRSSPYLTWFPRTASEQHPFKSKPLFTTFCSVWISYVQVSDYFKRKPWQWSVRILLCKYISRRHVCRM